jgi:hypothetical protein
LQNRSRKRVGSISEKFLKIQPYLLEHDNITNSKFIDKDFSFLASTKNLGFFVLSAFVQLTELSVLLVVVNRLKTIKLVRRQRHYCYEAKEHPIVKIRVLLTETKPIMMTTIIIARPSTHCGPVSSARAATGMTFRSSKIPRIRETKAAIIKTTIISSLIASQNSSQKLAGGGVRKTFLP